MIWSMSGSAVAIALTAVLAGTAVKAQSSDAGSRYHGASITSAVDAANAVWVVDPDAAGPNLPPVGRALFDFLVTRQVDGRTVYDVPYPFDELQRVIAARLGRMPENAFKRTLIPIGRSLQRFAAEPDFFAAPRVIVAVDRDAANGTDDAPLLRDRLFIGFQPRSQTIEVISYNEAAGRFEFQVVHDYGPDRTPQVLYAERRICTQCHQNHAPIFSRPLWSETTASPLVAARLQAEQPAFHGVSADVGVDPSDAIDLSTDRANMLSLYQTVWRDGCGADRDGIDCRSAGFLAALQYRLSGNRSDRGDAGQFRDRFAEVVEQNWQQVWPHGLAVPNPDIPNRDPLLDLPPGFTAFTDLVEPEGVRDPSTRRPPLAVWPAPDADKIDRAIAGLAGFLSAADMRRLDRHLRDDAAEKNRMVFESDCRVRVAGDEMRIRCQAGGEGPNRVALIAYVSMNDGRPSGGTVRRLAIADRDQLLNLDISAAQQTTGKGEWRLSLTLTERGAGLGARLTDGAAVNAVTLTAPLPAAKSAEFEARVAVGVSDDFAAVVGAVRRLRDNTASGRGDALAAQPFRRATLMAALFDVLGLPVNGWCCVESAMLPPAEAE